MHSTHMNVVRLIGVVATAFAVLTLLPASVEATPQRLGTPTDPGYGLCGDVRIIGVRGSSDALDYGETISKVVDSTIDQLVPTSLTIYDEALDYTAHGASLVELLADPSGFATSVQIGSSRLVTILRAHATNCPDQLLFLTGYSQGAWVIHDALDVIASEPSVEAVIGGVALIADPRRSSPDAANRGNVIESRGITSGLPIELDDPLASVFTSRSTSLCLKGDPVCDWPSGFVSRHGRYKTNGYTDTAARWLSNRARAIPSSLDRDLGDHDAGVALRLPIDRLGATGTQTFELAAPSLLPPGVRLSAGGVLVGTPHKEGRFEFVVGVTGPYGDHRWVTVRIGITSPVFTMSTAEDGTPADADAYGAAFLPPSRLSFASAATNLVPGDTNGAVDLFVKDLDSGAVSRYATPDGLTLTYGVPSPDGAWLAADLYDTADFAPQIRIIEVATGNSTSVDIGDGTAGMFWLGDSSGLVVSSPNDLSGEGLLRAGDELNPVSQLYVLATDGSARRVPVQAHGHPMSTEIVDVAGNRAFFRGVEIADDGAFLEPTSGAFDIEVTTLALRRFDLDAAQQPIQLGPSMYDASGNRLLYPAFDDPRSLIRKSAGKTSPQPVAPVLDGFTVSSFAQLDGARFAYAGSDGVNVVDIRTGVVRRLDTDDHGEPAFLPCVACAEPFLPAFYGPIARDGFVLFQAPDADGHTQVKMRRYDV